MHGAEGRFASSTTNWDDVAYSFVKEYFRNEPRINIHLTENFYQVAKIWSYKFLMTHGDQIKMHMNLPWYSITTKAMRWSGSIGHYDFLVLAHFHNFSHIYWNDIQIFVNGTFVTDDEWVRKMLRLTGSCVQTLLSVHPKRGIAFVKAISLEK